MAHSSASSFLGRALRQAKAVQHGHLAQFTADMKKTLGCAALVISGCAALVMETKTCPKEVAVCIRELNGERTTT